MQKDRLNEQETRLLQLQDLNERLRKDYQRLCQKHEKLRVTMYKQVELIYFLKKFAILQICKKLVSFVSQQTED